VVLDSNAEQVPVAPDDDGGAASTVVQAAVSPDDLSEQEPSAVAEPSDVAGRGAAPQAFRSLARIWRGGGGEDGTRQTTDGDGGEPDPARFFTRLLSMAVLTAVLLAAIRIFLIQTFVVPSGSMIPTLKVGDRLIVSRLDYRFGDVQRGDVVVFDGDNVFDPHTPQPSSPLARAARAVAGSLGVPVGEHDYVKRVIAVGGDTVKCCDSDGRLTVNGVPLQEKYLYPGDVPSLIRFSVTVPRGRLWVMGDHRSDSGDSRYHMSNQYRGTVPVDHVIGRVVAVWWPFSRMSCVNRVDSRVTTSASGKVGP
jgi:signal peptidase I